MLLGDGTYVFGDHQLLTPGSHGPVMGRAEANVVLSSVAFDALHVSQYHFAVFLVNSDNTKSARLYSFPDEFPGNVQNSFVPTRNSRFFGVGDDILRENTCDPVTGVCIALATSESWHMQSDGILPVLFTVLGTCVGAGLGVGWNYYRNRDRSLVSLLKKALAANSLALVYQPVVCIGSGRITGFEALIRWEITKGDFVPPDLFIARAETAGIADRITIYVVDHMLAEMGELLREQRDLRININMTAGDVQNPTFRTALEQRLLAADIDPHQIGLELTERTAVDFSKASEGIKDLRERGHRIYIDDFGTGYSTALPIWESCRSTRSRSIRLSPEPWVTRMARFRSFRRSFPWRMGIISISSWKVSRQPRRRNIFAALVAIFQGRDGFSESRLMPSSLKRLSLVLRSPKNADRQRRLLRNRYLTIGQIYKILIKLNRLCEVNSKRFALEQYQQR